MTQTQYKPGTWVGKQFYSLSRSWYSAEQVKAGLVEMEPSFWLSGRQAARTLEETIANARYALHNALTEKPQCRADQCKRKAQEKEVRAYVGHYARLLGVSGEQLWELVGLEHGGLWVP